MCCGVFTTCSLIRKFLLAGILFVTVKSSYSQTDISCSTTGASILSESVSNLVVRCPSGCKNHSSSVYGDVVYEGNSSVCRAAIHNANLTDSGGIVTIQKVNILSSFVGTEKNNITSQSQESSTSAFRFIKDIDECANNLDDCHSEATCTDILGSYTCACNSGYSGDGIYCEDVNECTNTQLNSCSGIQICSNTDGSHICIHDGGNSRSGSESGSGNEESTTPQPDVNECTENLHDCHSEATCTNIPDSYTCACNSGYSGNGTYCEDIDECATAVHNCNVYATCSNTQGSYTCTCLATYIGDGRICSGANSCCISLLTTMLALLWIVLGNQTLIGV